MFYFKEAAAAVTAGLEMAEEAPNAGLPPTHIGIQAGPEIFQDGDVYGRTVNLASRIADRAEAGEVLTSEVTVQQIEGVVDTVRHVGSGRPEGRVATDHVVSRCAGRSVGARQASTPLAGAENGAI